MLFFVKFIAHESILLACNRSFTAYLKFLTLSWVDYFRLDDFLVLWISLMNLGGSMLSPPGTQSSFQTGASSSQR